MKKNIPVVLMLTVILVLLSACGGARSEESVAPLDFEEERAMYAEPMMEAPAEMDAEMAYEAGSPNSSSLPSDSLLTTDRLIIRNGEINMEVDDTRQTSEAIKAIVGGLSDGGAFVLSAKEYGSTVEGNPQINMTIRIPAEAFDNVMEQIAGMARNVLSRTESADDVTEEYYDLENRLDSLEAARQRLLDIMENADTTEDLLQAEQQLTQRETEIESLKGRMKYLSQSSQLSRITITLQPYKLSQPIDTSWKPLISMREALDDLIDGVKGFIDFLIYFIIAVAPWLALFGYVIWQVIKYFRRRKAQNPEKSE